MQPFYEGEIKKVDNHEQSVQNQIDSLMPWINEDIDDGLDLEQVEKYRPVGILNIFGIKPSEVNVVFKGNDDKLYCGFIDERDEANIRFIYDEFRLVSENDKDKVIYFNDLFCKKAELQGEYSIGDIIISAYQLSEDEVFVGRIDKYVEFLKEYREKLKSSAKELVKEIEEDIEYYGVPQKYSKLREACEQYPELQLVPNGNAYQAPTEPSHVDRFVESFIGKLNNGEFKKETCPQVGREFNGTEEEVSSELESYQRLLDSGIIDEATKDCRTCQNMSCSVENSEKPVEDCFGYINYEKEEKGPVKKLVPNNKK